MKKQDSGPEERFREMILLKTLADVSEKVGATSRKKEKISLLAHLLQQGQGKEISLAALYLSGRLPQGRLGIGWATLQEALQGVRVSARSYTLADVDRFFDSLSREKGPGSVNRKTGLLQGLFSGVEEKERNFLIGLLMGEIRQGALEGLVLEGIAHASSLPGDLLRQSLMFSGDIGEVA